MKGEKIVKSKDRVQKFAEVYTPNWIVKDMVALTNAAEVGITVLEPACGNGNFLNEILEQKLINSKDENDALISLRSIYGIDIQDDNVEECKLRLCDTFLKHYQNIDKKIILDILDKNIVCGNFLTKRYYKNGKELDKTIWYVDDEPRLF